VEEDRLQQQEWKGNEILRQLQARNRSSEQWDLEEQKIERKNSLSLPDNVAQDIKLNYTHPVENADTSVMD